MTPAAATYAVPDLHGRHDLLARALDAIAGQGGGTVVFTGDYVDRGPGSRQVIERLMAGPPPGQSWVCLKGNHEDMMVEACAGRADLYWWLGNGGGETLQSYGARAVGRADLARVPAAQLDWLAALPLFHADAHRVYVHAGVEPGVALERQSPDTLLWKRYSYRADEAFARGHVVHGHQPYEDGPLLLRHRTDLDTLAYATGRLTVGVFDDSRPGGPVRLIRVQGPPQG